MKRLQAYFSFTRTERMAYLALVALLLALSAIYFSMQLWAGQPAHDVAKERQLVADWNAFRVKNSIDTDGEVSGATAKNEVAGILFPFDPNTIDSADFLKLGLNIRAVNGLMNWRRHNKKFYKKEDLKPLYHLSPEEYARIEPFIAIAANNGPQQGFQKYEKEHLPPLPAIIDLNATDSSTLVRLNGIGPALAHKIIVKRDLLGGFINHQQLLGIYRFPDSTYKMLQQKLVINPKSIHLLDLNTVTLEQLQNHPEIGEKTGKNILLYRDGLKHFHSVEELRQVPLMSEEIYRKIAPYFIVQ